MNLCISAGPEYNIRRFAESKRLLTLPEVAVRMVEIAQQPDPDYAEVARIVRTDPAISAKILKTANSALFAFRQRIETIEDALLKLGMSTLRTLV